jgi:hypothetical protein
MNQIVQRVCSVDPSHETKVWHKDPSDKTRYLCSRCYRKASPDMQAQKGRVCSVDSLHKAKSWHKDPINKTRYLCDQCYRKALTKIKAPKRNICSVDPSHKANQLFRDPFDKARYLCQECYQKTTIMPAKESFSNYPFHQRIIQWQKGCSDFKTQKRKFPESNSEEDLSKRLKRALIENLENQQLCGIAENETKEKYDSYFFDYQDDPNSELAGFSIMDPPFLPMTDLDEDVR